MGIYDISGGYGSGAGYAPESRSYDSTHPSVSPPTTFTEFTDQVFIRVSESLTDPWSYARQFALMWGGDVAGYGMRIGLRLAGFHNPLLLFAAQILADESFTALFTQFYRQADKNHHAWFYEAIEGVTARSAFMLGMRMLQSVSSGGLGGFVVRGLVFGSFLSAGSMVGEQITHALGSKKELGPTGVYGFGLRMVDTQTILLKGGAIRKGVGSFKVNTPWGKVRLNSDEIGKRLEAGFIPSTPPSSCHSHDDEEAHPLQALVETSDGEPIHIKSSGYFDYLSRQSIGLRTLYPIADVAIAREVFGEDDQNIHAALSEKKLPLTYLDGGASTKPLPTVEATRKAIMTHYANTHGHSHNPVRITDYYYRLAHDALLDFAGYQTGPTSSHAAIFVGQGTTDAINHVARLLFEKRSFQRVQVHHARSNNHPVVQAGCSFFNVVEDYAGSLIKGLDLLGYAVEEAFIFPTQRLFNRLIPWVHFEEAKDTVIFSGLGHHANILPWQVHAPHSVAVPLKNAETGALSLEQIKQALKDNRGRVRLVAISGTSNVTGLISDIKEVVRLAHEANAMVLVDGAHLFSHAMGADIPGIGKIDPGALGVDFLVGSGHKVYAPGAPGFVIMPKELSPEIPVRLGGGIVEDVYYDKAHFTLQLPDREEAGTPPITGAIMLASAFSTLKEIGMQRVWDHESRLTTQAIKGLEAINKVMVYGDTNLERTPRAGVISFSVNGLHHSIVSAALSDYFNIATRSGCFCAQPYVKDLMGIKEDEAEALARDIQKGDRRNMPGLVRASLGVYTSALDIERLIKAVQYIADHTDDLLSQYNITPDGVAHHTGAGEWMVDPSREPVMPF